MGLSPVKMQEGVRIKLMSLSSDLKRLWQKNALSSRGTNVCEGINVCKSFFHDSRRCYWPCGHRDVWISPPSVSKLEKFPIYIRLP